MLRTWVSRSLNCWSLVWVEQRKDEHKFREFVLPSREEKILGRKRWLRKRSDDVSRYSHAFKLLLQMSNRYWRESMASFVVLSCRVSLELPDVANRACSMFCRAIHRPVSLWRLIKQSRVKKRFDLNHRTLCKSIICTNFWLFKRRWILQSTWKLGSVWVSIGVIARWDSRSIYCWIASM